MLIAARSSQDFACCWRATASARWKCPSAFAASGSGDFSAISPATRLASASHTLSLVVSTMFIASPTQRQASSNCPSSAWALAKIDKCHGTSIFAPVVCHAVIPAVNISIAPEALPVRANTQPWFIIPYAFQNKTPFSSAKARTSSDCAFTVA